MDARTIQIIFKFGTQQCIYGVVGASMPNVKFEFLQRIKCVLAITTLFNYEAMKFGGYP